MLSLIHQGACVLQYAISLFELKNAVYGFQLERLRLCGKEKQDGKPFKRVPSHLPHNLSPLGDLDLKVT